MVTLLRALVVLLLLTSGHFSPSLAAAASEGEITVGTRDRYELSASFTYYADTTALVALEDLLQPEWQRQFVPMTQGPGSTNFGATNSALWFRLAVRVEPGAPKRWLLDVAYPPLDRIDLYVSNGSGGFDHQTGGDSLPFTQRIIRHHSHVKPVDFAPERETVIYLRVATQGTMVVPVYLWQPSALWSSDQKTYSIYGLYFGLLIGLVAYNLLLFFSVRDRVFLVYVAFAACIGVSQAANSGLGAQFLWPHQLWWNSIAINTMHSASAFFGLLFARSFLATQTRLPRLDVLLRIQLVLWLAVVCLTFLVTYRLAVWLVTVLVVIGVIFILVVALLSLTRRHPGAKYFCLAWAALLLGVVTLTLHNNGFLPSNALTANALLIGSSMEMVLLSFALADRINVTRREKEVAQAQVTSEQAMVLALQQSQERYRSVIEHVAEGMVLMQNQQVVFVNFRATEILEASKAAIMRDGVFGRLHNDDQATLAQRLSNHSERHPAQGRYEVRLMLDGQAMKWLEMGDTVVPWDGGPALLVFFLDITQRRAAEQETRSALNRQRELNDLRSRFVAMTSHEFRTPLATILSAQDILKNYAERLPDDQKKELFDMIESGVKRMTRMIERVLLVGQVEAHMLEFKPQTVNLAALCNDLIAQAKFQLPESRCAVSLSFASDVTRDFFDEQLLRHIFSNLLSNAIKYSPDGGAVVFAVFQRGAQTVFEVSDHGIGIPASELDHLFDPFHRASNVGAIDGTGLGLAIVKQAVETHGGSITVASSVGQGTRFTVSL